MKHISLTLLVILSSTYSAHAQVPPSETYLVFHPPSGSRSGYAAPIGRVTTRETGDPVLLISLEGSDDAPPFEIPFVTVASLRETRDAILSGRSINIVFCENWTFVPTGRPVYGCQRGIRTASFQCEMTSLTPLLSHFDTERYEIRNAFLEPISKTSTQCD